MSLKDADGAALANPLALNNGAIDFYTDESVGNVDLYIQSPTGHFAVVKDVAKSGDASIMIDTSAAQTVMVIPFDVDDQAGDATETGCGFTQIGAVQPNVAVHVVDVDATETVDFGTDSSDSGDADGFIDGISVATSGLIKATNANGSVTLGADLIVQDSANSGDDFPEQSTARIGKEFTYTFSSGADTASGFFIVPVVLPPTSL